MIYLLLYPLHVHFSAFNVLRYITFRSISALITALIISIVIGPAFIRWLNKLHYSQYIREEVVNHAGKAGTPTMGGLLIGFSFVISVLLWADLTNAFIWLGLFIFVGFGIIGFIDDHRKVVQKRNKGLSPLEKISAQIFVSTIAVGALVFCIGGDCLEGILRGTGNLWSGIDDETTALSVPFLKNILPQFGWFYLPFAVLVLVGSSNAVNLTDGLDGLAIGPVAVCAGTFALFAYVAGNVQIAKYLQIFYVPGVGEMTVYCAALVGTGLGFLWFNAHPAQVFMGDVGSLPLGAALGGVALVTKQELLLVIVGGLFVIEALSVVLQVGYFKVTKGKRFFRMAPIHHHFELKGIPESKIIIRCWIISILLALLALSTLKLR